MMTRALFLATLATSFAACGLPEDSADDVISADDLADGKTDNVASARSALPAGAVHLYFSNPNNAYVSDDQPLTYQWFTANKGTEFKVGVFELDADGNPVAGEHVGMKLQRAVKQYGKWVWTVVASADSDNGAATVKYTPKTGPGLYLVTGTGSPLPAALTANLACGGTNCATAQQPGQLCGGFAAIQCDSGLFCNYDFAAQCGAADQGGTCAVKPTVCPKLYRPTCGCNGKTYGNNCEANSAGTSVARVGTCDANVVGSWSYVNGAHYDYTFNADGTFVSTEQPACAFGNPRCLIKIAPATGVYYPTATDVTLTYTSDFRNGDTATFSIGKKGTHLTGTDWGTSVDLTRN